MMRFVKGALFAVLFCLAGCSGAPDMATARQAAQRQDYAAAAAHYQKLADFGLPEARMELGLLALKGHARNLSPAEGVLLLDEYAKAGDPRALFEVGNAYEKGIGVSRNIDLALSYYEKSGAAGYGRADYNRAVLYDKGKLVEKNPVLARALYKSAAEKGYEKPLPQVAGTPGTVPDEKAGGEVAGLGRKEINEDIN